MSNIYKYRFRFNAKHNTSFEVENIHVHTFEVVCYVKQIGGLSITMTPAVTRMAKIEAYSFANNLSTCLLVN